LQTVDKIVDLVSACKNPATGESVVEDVEVCDRTNPRDLDPTESDIVFIWKGAPMAFLHPQFGQIGPVPYRRTGGHTGDSGFACIAAAGVPAGDYGSRSSFDVVPTLIELTNARVESTLETSGRSLLKAIC
jgi:hypothetical protein